MVFQLLLVVMTLILASKISICINILKNMMLGRGILPLVCGLLEVVQQCFLYPVICSIATDVEVTDTYVVLMLPLCLLNFEFAFKELNSHLKELNT